MQVQVRERELELQLLWHLPWPHPSWDLAFWEPWRL